MKKQYWIVCLGIVWLGVSSLDARQRALTLQKKSRVADKKITMPRAEMSERSSLQNKRFGITEWHKQYSSLGRKRAPLTFDGNSSVDKSVQFSTVDRKMAPISVSGKKRKMAEVRNWNRVREAVMVSKYSDEITSPVGRHIQDVVDEVSLAQINRFQTVRNSEADKNGIPVQQAGQTGEQDKEQALQVQEK